MSQLDKLISFGLLLRQFMMVLRMGVGNRAISVKIHALPRRFPFASSGLESSGTAKGSASLPRRLRGGFGGQAASIGHAEVCQCSSLKSKNSEFLSGSTIGRIRLRLVFCAGEASGRPIRSSRFDATHLRRVRCFRQNIRGTGRNP
jgi:hypothetical protein